MASSSSSGSRDISPSGTDKDGSSVILPSTCSQPNPQGSPQSLPSFSPTSRRRRLRNLTKRNIEAILGTSPPSAFVSHIPRDPTQPRSGSISDVHSEASLDDDTTETDYFHENLTAFRPRSHTCPESRSWQFKARMRNRNRPPTPPPGGADDSLLENELAKFAIREKLRIPNRDLPSAIPEVPGRDRATEATNGAARFSEQEMFVLNE